VERNDASEETRGKPQAKETHGEQQAAAPRQGQSANDWLWHFIAPGASTNKHDTTPKSQ
jgi:hypothetical protein